jgi:AraC-like DNA-binding protein
MQQAYPQRPSGNADPATLRAVDALAGLLDWVRARGAFVLRLSLDPPWAMRIQDEAPLTVLCQIGGKAAILGDAGSRDWRYPGDVAVARGTRHYVFADSPATAPQVIIAPGQRCTTLAGADLRFEMALGVRTWGNSDAGRHRCVIGAYEGRSAVSARLLDALPPVVIFRDDDGGSPLTPLPAAEAGREGSGQEVFLDRLLDLILIDALRTWFDRADTAPRWWHAERDALVGPALRLMYARPEHPWTVADLAAAVGCSRAVLARRFTELVGEPPIAFLTGWRLAPAADMLRGREDTIATVAHRVGYSTPFAFSSAFKRTYGFSPNEHRRQVG